MGWVFNTVNEAAPTTGPQITATALALTAISLLAVCLRLYVRLFIIKAAGPDDWVISFAWVTAAGFAIVTGIQTRWGLGLLNVDDLPPADIFTFGLLQYIGAPFYITSILGFKLSLLLSYLRFITQGAFRWATIIVIVITVMLHMTFLLVQLFLCQPVSKQWDPAVEGGSCVDAVPFYTSMGALIIVIDVAIMLLPFPILTRSQIQRRKKVVLLSLFGLGIFITAIQIIRIQTIKRLVNYTDSAPIILWSAVENNLGIMVACIPTLAPLVKYFSERSKDGSGQNSKKSKQIGSHYALQSWNATKRGMESLHSGRDIDHEAVVEGGGRSQGDSTDCILDPAGIVKKTEVKVTRA